MNPALPVSNVNGDPIDCFTVSHAGWGMVYQQAGFTPGQAAFVGLLWDVFAEPWLKERFPNAFPFPSQDSVSNILVDTAATLVGYELSRRYLQKTSAAKRKAITFSTVVLPCLLPHPFQNE